MRINKNSWHYRLIQFADKIPSKNLCMYFWQVIGCSFMFLIMSIVIAAALTLIPLSMFGPIFMALSSAIEVFGIILWMITGFISLGFAKDWVLTNPKHWLSRNIWKRKEHVKDKEPNIVFEYIKAKKRKVCPPLEFVD